MALDFRLLTTLKGAGECSEDTAALSAAWFHVLYYTSVHVCQSAICILHGEDTCAPVQYAYCTGAHVSSPYITLSAPLMTTYKYEYLSIYEVP